MASLPGATVPCPRWTALDSEGNILPGAKRKEIISDILFSSYSNH